jgi:hypothetical protein
MLGRKSDLRKLANLAHRIAVGKAITNAIAEAEVDLHCIRYHQCGSPVRCRHVDWAEQGHCRLTKVVPWHEASPTTTIADGRGDQRTSKWPVAAGLGRNLPSSDLWYVTAITN